MPHLLLATTLFVSAASVVTVPDPTYASSRQAAAFVATRLREAKAVNFYFLSRTEEWNYTPDEVVEKSSIRAYRECGGNCHNFMQPVLSHLRHARPIKCIAGQEDGVIRAEPGVELVYSLSGRQIRVAGGCCFNDQGIKKVVSGSSMLFSSRQALSGPRLSINHSFKPNPLRGSH